MIKSDIFKEINGLDENLKVAFNDIDLCMKVRNKGYLIVYTPYARLMHYESKSRGMEDTKEKIQRFEKEMDLFKSKWSQILNDGDPYFNVNFRLDKSNFYINTNRIGEYNE